MNILHMKYAVEVANAGSLSKASEAMFIAVPNISRSVKELEADLGITIFDRTAKGMILTPEGEEFIAFAKSILKQIDDVEKHYKAGVAKKQKFSVSVPRASYISWAFAEFSKTLTADMAEVFYEETNSGRTIKNVLENDYKLGVIRYADIHDKHFKSMFEEKGLNYEIIAEFSFVLLMSEDNPLAKADEICCDDLAEYIEIAHADPYVPWMSMSKVIKDELPDNVDRRIFVFERASQFELLWKNNRTYMWVSPIPDDLEKRYGLIQKKCADNTKLYKDVLIYRNGYKLTETDKQFITQLCETKRKYL